VLRTLAPARLAPDPQIRRPTTFKSLTAFLVPILNNIARVERAAFVLGQQCAILREDDEGMNDVYVYVQDLRQQAKVPEDGILSQTLQNDDRTRVILFGFAPGQELSAHTAPFPAMLTFLKGDALLKLGSEEQRATEGTFVYMRPNLEHGIKAQTEVVMLLAMIKNTPATPA